MSDAVFGDEPFFAARELFRRESHGRGPAAVDLPRRVSRSPVGDSGVRHPLIDGRHSAFCQDDQILCTRFPMLQDLPIGHRTVTCACCCRRREGDDDAWARFEPASMLRSRAGRNTSPSLS
jgi:hypothetical protein